MRTKPKHTKQKQHRRLVIGRQKVIIVLSVIALIVLVLGAYSLVTNKDKTPVVEGKPSQSTGSLTVSNQPVGNITLSNQEPNVSEILTQINNMRTTNNLPAVSENKSLHQSAAAKLADMISRNYWAHNAPDGTEPWVFIQKVGYKYQYAGENLWNGYSNSTVRDWLISPTHKAVMLDTRYTEMGIAVQKANNYNGQQNVWVVVTHYASPYTGSPSSYKPMTSTKSSGSGYQYELPDYNPEPMPDFDNGRSSSSYQSGTQQNCGSSTDSSYYANCVGQ